MTELNQKLTKHSQKMLDTGCLHGGKNLCKNLGVKEGGGCLLEGGVFSGAYGTKMKGKKAWGFLSYDRSTAQMMSEVSDTETYLHLYLQLQRC